MQRTVSEIVKDYQIRGELVPVPAPMMMRPPPGARPPAPMGLRPMVMMPSMGTGQMQQMTYPGASGMPMAGSYGSPGVSGIPMAGPYGSPPTPQYASLSLPPGMNTPYSSNMIPSGMPYSIPQISGNPPISPYPGGHSQQPMPPPPPHPPSQYNNHGQNMPLPPAGSWNPYPQ